MSTRRRVVGIFRVPRRFTTLTDSPRRRRLQGKPKPRSHPSVSGFGAEPFGLGPFGGSS